MEDNGRKTLMNRLRICDFVLIETNLFLDTHPTCKEALDHFAKYQKLRQETAREYIEKYGPITAGDYNGTATWEWVNDPWPWELEA